MFRKTAVMFLMLAFVLQTPVWAAVFITESIEGETETHIYHRGVYYHLESGQLTHRFDSGRNYCLAVNHDAKLYFEGDCDTMIEGVSTALSEMVGEQLATLTSEEKAMMQSFMSAVKGREQKGRVSVKSIGVGKHLGHDVEKHVIAINDSPYTEIWVSKAVQLMVEKEFALSRYKAWSQAMEREMAGFQQQLGVPVEGPDPLADAWESVVKKGYPVKNQPGQAAAMMQMMVSASRAMDVSEEREVTSIEQKSDFNPRSLDLPAEYTRAASWTEFMQHDMQALDGD